MNSESLDCVDYLLFTLGVRVIFITSTQIHFLDDKFCQIRLKISLFVLIKVFSSINVSGRVSANQSELERKSFFINGQF